MKRILLMLAIHIAIVTARVDILFSPRDNLQMALIQLIDQEMASIDAAMYMLSDKLVAQALLNAYIRGVKVRLVLDQCCMGEKFGKGLMLQNNGITIFVHYAPPINAFMTPIMHHKFFVFGKNCKTLQPLVWSGSYNATTTAAKFNDENVMICDDPHAIAQYRECFKALVTRLDKRYYFVGFDFEEDEAAIA